jgi:predicted phage terminase large subunit-like protein
MVYEKAIRDDGSLLFPEKLSEEFLFKARSIMGSYIFANQYQNEIIPDGLQVFKEEWFKYYSELPKRKHTFAMIDPAIGQEDHHDYTGIVVIDVDEDANWYIRVAKRARYTPTELVDLVFRINDQFHPKVIGIESVAYQKALLYMLDEEMKRRQRVIPAQEVHPGTDKSKEMRISGVLVPRYEWGRIYHAKGLEDLESELLLFPRASHDDICDALSTMDNIITYPEKEKKTDERPNSPAHPDYERWYIKNGQKARQTVDEDY